MDTDSILAPSYILDIHASHSNHVSNDFYYHLLTHQYYADSKSYGVERTSMISFNVIMGNRILPKNPLIFFVRGESRIFENGGVIESINLYGAPANEVCWI